MMFRRLSATPCPVPSAVDQILDTEFDEATTTIDFTTELRASFRNAKPRRKQRSSVSFIIHEDEKEAQFRPHADSALYQPPRRAGVTRPSRETPHEKQRSPTVNNEGVNTSIRRHDNKGARLGQAPKRLGPRLSTLPEVATNDTPMRSESPATKIVRPARRGTIYIPSDDTTMPSMYMGIFSPIKDLELSDDGAQTSRPQVEVTGIAAQMAMKRSNRKSIIGTAPRRGPLLINSKPMQETVQVEDRFGQGDGKENVPPGKVEMVKYVEYASDNLEQNERSKVTAITHKPLTAGRPNIHAPTTSSLLRRDSPKLSAMGQPSARPAWNSGSRPNSAKPIPAIPSTYKPASPLLKTITPKPRVPTRFVVPVIHSETALQKHAMIQDDITNPALYEEDWLQHQEIVITQLVNNLLATNISDGDDAHQSLRARLLKVYGSPDMVLMHKRLQAALLYGALGIPQDTLDQGMRLQNDVGLKKQFTDLWLSTYDQYPLECALEVVTGRECRSENLHPPNGNLNTSKNNKSGLRNFIEAFLIRNEDGRSESARDHMAWSYRRTVFRSLLLIKLLDAIKSEKIIGMKGCLFLHSSRYKTSSAVVQSLMQMLNPAAGDPTRALKHVNYHVSHSQYPLEEYNYNVENLAVDLRDGVRLTRLVEILLYPSCSQAFEKSFDGNTTTIFMPEGDTVDFTHGQDWPLSQHLKMPCQSRAVMLWNVQLALSAIGNVKGMDVLTGGITAMDIVDGFREKTIRLLWALVGKCGLSGLINWQDLKWEIRRLEGGLITDHNGFDDDDVLHSNELSFETCKGLLKRWARAVASRHNVHIRNFTTSFSDGKAFEAIVDEYEHYFSSRIGPSSNALYLQDRLIQLGCSDQFAKLFSGTNQVHVFDRDFVLAALAFLCSRLLAPTQRIRAATAIQQTWRNYFSKIENTRKAEKRRIALACANQVMSKHELPSANAIPSHGMHTDLTHTDVKVAARELPLGPLSPSSNSGTDDIWLTL